MKQVKVIVKGEVQGVFFRDLTRKKAEQLGIVGWVRNLPFGEVEAMFQGEEKAVDEIVEFCRNGPELANVKSIDIKEQELQEFDSFRIL